MNSKSAVLAFSLLIGAASGYGDSFLPVYWSHSASQDLAVSLSGESFDYYSRAWECAESGGITPGCSGMDSTPMAFGASGIACVSENCTRLTSSGQYASGHSPTTWTCAKATGSRCTNWTAGGLTPLFHCNKWKCADSSPVRECTEWQAGDCTDRCYNGDEWHCTGWNASFCAEWTSAGCNTRFRSRTGWMVGGRPSPLPKASFTGPSQAGPALPGQDVEFHANASGENAGTCEYAMPKDAIAGTHRVLGGSGNEVEYDLAGGSLRFRCNFSAENYSIAFSTEPATRREEWKQAAATPATTGLQALENTIFITNPSSLPYLVELRGYCPPGGECNPTTQVINIEPQTTWNATAEFQADWIADETSAAEEGNCITTAFTAASNAPATLNNVTAEIPLSNTAAGASAYLVERQGETANETRLDAGGNCSEMQATSVGDAVWKACLEDGDGNGAPEKAVVIIPRILPNASRIEIRIVEEKPAPTQSPSPPPSEPPASPPGSRGTGSGSSSSSYSASITLQLPPAASAPAENQSQTGRQEPQPAEQNEAETTGCPPSITVDYFLGEVRLLRVSECGRPARGKITVTGPDGVRHYRLLSPNGTAEFFFGREGDWTVEYGNASKAVKILMPVLPKLPSGTAANATRTGMAAAASEPAGAAVPLIAAMAAVAAAAALKTTSGKTRLEKKRRGDSVEITVSAGGGGLSELELSELVPPEFPASAPDCEARETVIGTLLRWRKETLEKGGQWRVEYETSRAAGARTMLKFKEKRKERTLSLGG